MKENTEETPLNLTFDRMLCPRHGEPFRAKWPAGYGQAIILMFQKVIELPGALADARRIAGVSGDEEVDVAVMEQVLDEKPACCRLSPPDMFQIYTTVSRESAEFGRRAKCQVCGESNKLGTPYKTATVEKKHVCFRCVIFRMRPDVSLN